MIYPLYFFDKSQMLQSLRSPQSKSPVYFLQHLKCLEKDILSGVLYVLDNKTAAPVNGDLVSPDSRFVPVKNYYERKAVYVSFDGSAVFYSLVEFRRFYATEPLMRSEVEILIKRVDNTSYKGLVDEAFS